MFVCSVCYEPFNYDVNPASLPCGHVFCEGDIRRIPAYGSSQCPTCRKPFTPRDIRKVYMACDLNSRSDHGLSASQHQSAEILAAQMRDLDISATDNEIARVLGGARAWSRSLEGISDKKVKTSLARFTLSLDLANARVLETSYLRDQLKQARSEQTRLNAKLQEESRRFNAAVTDNSILMRQLAQTTNEVNAEKRSIEVQLRAAKSEIIHLSCRLAHFERPLANSPQDTSGRSASLGSITLGGSFIPSQATKFIRARAHWSHNLNHEVEEDLSFREGETIWLVNKPIDSGIWWIGKLKGEIGCVPDACIKISPSSGVGQALKSHNLSMEVGEDLTFKKRREIELVNKPFGIWWIGLKDGKFGCVPSEKLTILPGCEK